MHCGRPRLQSQLIVISRQSDAVHVVDHVHGNDRCDHQIYCKPMPHPTPSTCAPRLAASRSRRLSFLSTCPHILTFSCRDMTDDDFQSLSKVRTASRGAMVCAEGDRGCSSFRSIPIKSARPAGPSQIDLLGSSTIRSTSDARRPTM
jgi:hypothetical protein